MIADLRHETVNTINQSKKDNQASIKKKEEGVKQLKTEIESSSIKNSKDLISLQDKLQRLAAQFDKELMTRDK